MNLLERVGDWLHHYFFEHRAYVPTDDPEVRDLAERIATLREQAHVQEHRLNRVEIRVGIRSPDHWRDKRDAG